MSEIDSPRQFRTVDVVTPTTPKTWEPPERDQPAFEPQATFELMREEEPNLRFALFSGGYDSLVACHYAMENDLADVILHANTLTAVPENTEFVKEVCQHYRWPLKIIDSPKTLKEFCLTTNNGEPYGFPGGGAHSIAFRWLKERPFRIAAKNNPERKPDLVTGVRRRESKKRMRTVKGEIQEVDRFIWKAPLWDKSDQWMENYLVKHNLPRSITVEVLDRSGDCFCGSFADRLSELDRLQNPWDHQDHDHMVRLRHLFGAPKLARFEEALQDHHDWLMSVEEQVQAEIGSDHGYCYWGHPSEDSKALRDEKSRKDDCQVVLCENCEDRSTPWETKPMEETDAERRNPR